MREKANHALAINKISAAADLSLALASAGLYGLNAASANRLVAAVRTAIAPWWNVARALGAIGADLLSMASAFRR